jgi:protein TonB
VKDNRHIILRYLKSRRKGKAANRVERMAMQDAFLAEALAGYEKHAGNHAHTIVELERRIEAQIPAARRGNTWLRLPAGMVKAINIHGNDWTALIFESRNQGYGAYDIRRSSSRRHLLSYAAIAALVVLALMIPAAMRVFMMDKPRDEMLAVTTLSDIKMEMPEENKIEQVNVPPPPALKSTIKFTAPVIKKDEEVPDEDIKTQEELFEAKEAISIADVRGNDDETGIDIADLEAHKLITEQKDEVFIAGSVEQNPEFPGGMDALMKWIYKELKYPVIAMEMGIGGRVTVSFVVGKDGAIRDIAILRGIDPSLDKEALRVVSKMPKWIPGRQGGNAVSVKFILPIGFQLK